MVDVGLACGANTTPTDPASACDTLPDGFAKVNVARSGKGLRLSFTRKDGAGAVRVTLFQSSKGRRVLAKAKRIVRFEDRTEAFTGFPGTTACTAGGTTGRWYAASGNSNGWQEWDMDLSAFAGKQVEVSISYVTDWATLPSPGRAGAHGHDGPGHGVPARPNAGSSSGAESRPGRHLAARRPFRSVRPLTHPLAASDTLPRSHAALGRRRHHISTVQEGKMSRRAIGVLAGAVLAMVLVTAPAQASSGINAYRFKATAKTVEKLALAGFDVSEGRRAGGRIEVYGTKRQMARLARKEKIRGKLVRDRRGRTSVRRSVRMVRRGLAASGKRSLKQAGSPTAAASDAAYKVYRKYDAVPGDGHEQYTEMYDRVAVQHPTITEKVVLGKTEWGRDIIAMQVTRNATGADNGKPAVLYNAMQHAREWLAGETCKRTLDYFTRLYGKDRQVTRLVNERQLWFVCVNNPDGYEFTFTPGNRLWRKNLHEQNGQPGIQNGDGVDPNRNFPVNWGLDDEGSSPDLASETYRGPSAASEPETKAMLKLWEMVPFVFQKNDHTAAELILYPQGWQQYTPSADDPIFRALAGDDADPAIQGFDPDLGAELYITNGDTLDTAYNRKNILAYTPEGSEPHSTTVSGFEFEDVEGLIENEFRDHLPFVLDLAESADDPDNPESHLGNTVDDYYVDSFAYSYGDPQTVQVLAKRDLGAVTMKYRVNGGAAQSVGDVGVERRPALLPGGRPGVPPPARRRHGHEPRRLASRSGSRTRNGQAHVGLVHLLGPERARRAGRQARAPAGGGGLHGPDARGRRRPAELPHELPEALTAATGFAPSVYDVDAMGRQAPRSARRARALRRGDLVHGRRLPDPRAGPGAGHRDVAARARRGRRHPRLPQRGRQGVPRRQARGPAVLRGLRVPQRGLPAAQRGQARRVVRRRTGRGQGRLHRAHQRLLPVLPRRVPARGGRRVVGRRHGRRAASRRQRAVHRHVDAGRRGRRPGRGRADVDAGVDVVAAATRRPTTTSPRSSRTGTGSRPARSRRTPGTSTCSRAATTRRTSGCRRRSTCRPGAGR